MYPVVFLRRRSLILKRAPACVSLGSQWSLEEESWNLFIQDVNNDFRRLDLPSTRSFSSKPIVRRRKWIRYADWVTWGYCWHVRLRVASGEMNLPLSRLCLWSRRLRAETESDWNVIFPTASLENYITPSRRILSILRVNKDTLEKSARHLEKRCIRLCRVRRE